MFSDISLLPALVSSDEELEWHYSFI